MEGNPLIRSRRLFVKHSSNLNSSSCTETKGQDESIGGKNQRVNPQAQGGQGEATHLGCSDFRAPFNMPSVLHKHTHAHTHAHSHTHTHTHTHSYTVPQKHSRKSHAFRIIRVQMLNSFLDPVRVKFL